MLIALIAMHLLWLSEIAMLGFICRMVATHGLSLPAILALAIMTTLTASSQSLLKSLRQSYREIKVMRQLTAALNRKDYQGWLALALAHKELKVVKESLPLVLRIVANTDTTPPERDTNG